MTLSISLALSLSKSLSFSVFFLSISHSPIRLDHNATGNRSLLLGGSSPPGSNPCPSKIPPNCHVAESIIKQAIQTMPGITINNNVERLRKTGAWKN